LFSKAIEWRWIDHKPATIKRLHEDRGRITYLTKDQIKRLLDAAVQDQFPHIYPFIVIGLGTSMRRSEILSIRLEHIDLDRCVIFIPHAKAGAREQPITSPHVTVSISVKLEGQLAPQAPRYVFLELTRRDFLAARRYRRPDRGSPPSPTPAVSNLFRTPCISDGGALGNVHLIRLRLSQALPPHSRWTPLLRRHSKRRKSQQNTRVQRLPSLRAERLRGF
jgi:integrase